MIIIVLLNIHTYIYNYCIAVDYNIYITGLDYIMKIVCVSLLCWILV